MILSRIFLLVVAVALLGIGAVVAFGPPPLQEEVARMLPPTISQSTAAASLLFVGGLTGLIFAVFVVPPPWRILNAVPAGVLVVLSGLETRAPYWLVHELGLDQAQVAYGLAIMVGGAYVVLTAFLMPAPPRLEPSRRSAPTG